MPGLASGIAVLGGRWTRQRAATSDDRSHCVSLPAAAKADMI
jgi:hypothetical protein